LYQLREALADKMMYAINYRTVTEDGLEYFQIKAVRAGDWDNRRGAVLGFRSVDAETRREMEKKYNLQQREIARLEAYIEQQRAWGRERNIIAAESREKAKTLIMMGQVYVENQKSDKPGTPVPVDAKIEVRGGGLPYVSRGGLKLEKAMETFGIMLQNKICIDIGASTGGFTDCMLQEGAKYVYAVDVGYGQIAWKLRTHPKVVNLERTNVRHITKEQIPEMIHFASVDVSFISLTLVLPVAYRFLQDDGEMVCLIKPQFEAGKENVGKKGVVRDPAVHCQVIEKIRSFVLNTGK